MLELRSEGLFDGNKLGSSEGKILDSFDVHVDGTALSDGITDGRIDGMMLTDGMVIKDGTTLADCVVLTDGFALFDGSILADGMALPVGSVLSDGILLLTDGIALTDSIVFMFTGDGMMLTD